MASIVSRANGRKEIQFSDTDGKRKTIRLGKVNKKSAQQSKHHIEILIGTKITASKVIPDETSRWLAELSDVIHDRLEKHRLVEPRARSQQVTLSQFVDEYIDIRKHDCEASTIRKMRSSLRQMVKCVGGTTPLEDVTPADAYRYQLARRETCEQASVCKDIKIAKTAFSHALRLGYVGKSPFDGIVAGTDENPENSHYFPIDQFERLIEACPDSTWRTIIALARLGGLRVPSEFNELRWRDVNLVERRMIITSPKTRKKRPQRRLRIFPRLAEILEEHFELSAHRSEFVIDNLSYRSPNANLRTQLGKMLAAAGIPSFPRPFDNFRASVSTDLNAIFPIKKVADWLGHNERTAFRYYNMCGERDYTEAEIETLKGYFDGDAKSDVKSDVIHGRQGSSSEFDTADVSTAESSKSTKKPAIPGEKPVPMRIVTIAGNCSESVQMTPTGLEPVLPP